MTLISLTRIILSSYLLTSLINPTEVVQITSEFLSFLFNTYKTNSPKHKIIIKSFGLFIHFIILFNLIGLNSIISFFQKPIEIPIQPTTQSIISSPKPTLQSRDIGLKSTIPLSIVRIPIESRPAEPVSRSDLVMPDPASPSITKEEASVPVVQLTTPEDSIPLIENPIQPTFALPIPEDDSHIQSESSIHSAESTVNESIPSVEPVLKGLSDEAILFRQTEDDAPSLTQLSESVSTQSSSLSTQDSTTLKNRFQNAMQKVSKSQKNEVDIMPQKDQLDVTPQKKSNRFSTIRMKRKSKLPDDPVFLQPEVKPSKSISTKLQKGLKNTGKRFSKIFS